MNQDITQDQRLIELAGNIPNVQAQVDRLVIDGPPAQVKATELLKTIKSMKKTIADKKDEFAKPLNKILKAIRDKAKDMTAPLLEMENKLRGGLVKYQEYLEDERRKAEAKQREEAAAKQAELDRLAKEAEKAETFDDMVKAEEQIEQVEEKKLTVAPEVHNKIKGAGGSVSFRKIPKYRLVNIKLVPEHLLTINMAAVQRLIDKGVKNIPGFEIYMETITSVR